MKRFLCCFNKPIPSPQIIKWSDTVPFVPPIYHGMVIKVYDGDTITVASKLPYDNSPLYRFSVRLGGIDSPEIKGKTEEEKAHAIIARNALSELILHKHIHLKNVRVEKYGRVLADVYLEDIWVNKWMLDNNHVIPYNGGKKPIWNFNKE